uniref:Uncharacterized protein n=1 Tax=Kalanchoe fedtschenkoi TaxID=63787 RepID=A0A7N0UBT8_KALFE
MGSSHTCKPGIISVSIVSLLLLLCSLGDAARPIGVPKSEDRRDPYSIKLFDELLIRDVKESGPSPGVGHKFPISAANLGGIKVASTPSLRQILGGIKDAGPSPGEGHKYADSRPLSASLNESGPSPGVGH